MRRILLAAVVMPLLALPACSGPTAPSLDDLQRERALWASHNLTKYSYDFEMVGFFNNLSGKLIHLVVLSDTVRSAVFVATGETVPVPAAILYTIDGLFDQATEGIHRGTLARVQVDSRLSYPGHRPQRPARRQRLLPGLQPAAAPVVPGPHVLAWRQAIVWHPALEDRLRS